MRLYVHDYIVSAHHGSCSLVDFISFISRELFCWPRHPSDCTHSIYYTPNSLILSHSSLHELSRRLSLVTTIPRATMCRTYRLGNYDDSYLRRLAQVQKRCYGYQEDIVPIPTTIAQIVSIHVTQAVKIIEITISRRSSRPLRPLQPLRPSQPLQSPCHCDHQDHQSACGYQGWYSYKAIAVIKSIAALL